MFKLKFELKIKTPFKEPGSFVGVIFKNDSDYYWKLISWNKKLDLYSRTDVFYNIPDVVRSNTPGEHVHKHSDVAHYVISGYWKIVEVKN